MALWTGNTTTTWSPRNDATDRAVDDNLSALATKLRAIGLDEDAFTVEVARARIDFLRVLIREHREQLEWHENRRLTRRLRRGWGGFTYQLGRIQDVLTRPLW